MFSTELRLINKDVKQDLVELDSQIGRFYTHYETIKNERDVMHSNWGDEYGTFLREYDEFMIEKNRVLPTLFSEVWLCIKEFNNPSI